MASDKQIKANQANSKRSTGPKTDEGKAAVSKNAMKHGILSSETILDWENKDEFLTLRNDLVASLNPGNELERLLVDRIISLFWRLKRIVRIENGVYSTGRYFIQHDIAVSELNDASKGNPAASKEHLESALKLLIDIGLTGYSDLPDLATTFKEQENTFNVLNRYESGVEKSLYKALHELQRLQALRLGRPLNSSMTLDIL